MEQSNQQQQQNIESCQLFQQDTKASINIYSLNFFSDEEIDLKPRAPTKFNTFKKSHKININPFLSQYCKSTSLSLTSEESKTPVEAFSQFKQVKIIGQGAHSVVKLVKHNDGKYYAAKIFQRANDEEIIEQAKEEFNLLKRINHDNIIKASQMIHNQNLQSFAILLEFFKGRSLKKQKHYAIQEIQNILKQLLETIVYLHTENIVHRDISIQNVLYNQDKQQIKLIDFGSAKQQKTAKDVMCTPVDSSYSAPEQSQGGIYHNKVDIWSAGHILYYLLTGYNIDKESLLELVVNQKLDEIECNFVELINLLKQMLVIDEKDRITAIEALKHQFFTEKF